MRDTIDMTREANAKYIQDLGEFALVGNENLKRFEALVRADERDRAMRENAYVQAEREACAKVCEGLPMQQEVDVRDECAAAIRARGNT